jgi:hypothetical protein
MDLHTLAAAADRKQSLVLEKSPLTTGEAHERNKQTSRHIHLLIDEVGRALHKFERMQLYKKSDTFVRLKDEYGYFIMEEERCKEYAEFVTEHVTMNRNHMKRLLASVLEQCTSDAAGMSIQRFRYNPFPDFGMDWDPVFKNDSMAFGAPFRTTVLPFDPLDPETMYQIPQNDFTRNDFELCRVFDTVSSFYFEKYDEEVVNLIEEFLSLRIEDKANLKKNYENAFQNKSVVQKIQYMKEKREFVQSILLEYTRTEIDLSDYVVQKSVLRIFNDDYISLFLWCLSYEMHYMVVLAQLRGCIEYEKTNKEGLYFIREKVNALRETVQTHKETYTTGKATLYFEMKTHSNQMKAIDDSLSTLYESVRAETIALEDEGFELPDVSVPDAIVFSNHMDATQALKLENRFQNAMNHEQSYDEIQAEIRELQVAYEAFMQELRQEIELHIQDGMIKIQLIRILNIEEQNLFESDAMNDIEKAFFLRQKFNAMLSILDSDQNEITVLIQEFLSRHRILNLVEGIFTDPQFDEKWG